MPEQVLKEIISVEAEAEAMEKQAAQEARDIVLDAKTQAAALLETVAAEMDAYAANRLKKTEADMQEQMRIIAGTIDEECTSMKNKAITKIDPAADFIMGRIVSASGNH